MSALACQQRYRATDNGRLKHAANQSAWRERNPERAREQRRWAKIKYRYGLTKEAYEAILAEQSGACAGDGCTDVPTDVDHDHECCPGPRSCGECVRGLLCSSCNRLDVLNTGKR